ncbi:FDXHR family putative zinc-binding protein [Frankia sp. AgKG'84/4]
MPGRDSEYERPLLLSCGGCDACWTALTAAHCPTCHATFAGATSGFDAHRVDGACEAPPRVGLREDRGYWLLGAERPPGRILHRARADSAPAGPAPSGRDSGGPPAGGAAMGAAPAREGRRSTRRGSGSRSAYLRGDSGSAPESMAPPAPRMAG